MFGLMHFEDEGNDMVRCVFLEIVCSFLLEYDIIAIASKRLVSGLEFFSFFYISDDKE